MGVILYKCPNCGGKVDFHEEQRQWYCSYCNNKFDALFQAKESLGLPDIAKQEFSFYKHTCKSCGKTYISIDENNAYCLYCGAKNDGGFAFPTSALIKEDIDLVSASKLLEKKLKECCPKELDSLYINTPFQLEYMNFSIIDGYIEIRYRSKSTRYLFINLVIPNDEVDDYRFMYEMGNDGIDSSKLSQSNPTSLPEDMLQSSSFLTHVEEDLDGFDLLEETILHFMRVNHVFDRNDLTIQHEIVTRRGVFLPVFRKKIMVHNQCCNQYVFGNRVFNRKVFIEYPNDEDSIPKWHFFNLLHGFGLFGVIIATILLLYLLFGGELTDLLFHYAMSEEMFLFGLLIYAILLTFSVGVIFVSKRKKKYYFNSVKLTKEEYIDQLLNNSNFVKSLKG